ncbi:MAG TPA: sugar phosphate isomerase/epimerase [Solirubrobacterales bacterium]|nr:sugar phosphate isomerase/epimerase [Solirubrobacterales bacterium]
MTKPRPRIAAAPISWGQCEVPGWGHQIARERVLEEMVALGIGATEAGPDGFLPDDPSELREFLAAYAMSLVGGFTPLVLHGDEARWRAAIDTVSRRFAAAAGEVVVIAAATGMDDYDARPELSADDWTRFLRALDGAAEIAATHGVRTVLHPHLGTMVETPEDIDRVLEGSSAALCLDTGHVMLGGGDPVALSQQAPERIAHLHLKDVDADLAARVVAGELTFSQAVPAGVFRPLGDGDVDLAAIIDSVRAAGYGGWYVMEQDVMLAAEPPAGEGPRTDVARSLDFLGHRLFGVAP